MVAFPSEKIDADFLSPATLRQAFPADLPLLSALELKSQRHPWSAELFRGEFENPHSRIDLLALEGEVLGYICYHSLADEVSIINLATLPVFRRRGVARRLLWSALHASGQEPVERAFLEVRAGNHAALALYESLGFRVVGRRKGYYRDGEDALVMAWTRNAV